MIAYLLIYKMKIYQLKIIWRLCNYPPYISPLTPYCEIIKVHYFSRQDFVITKNLQLDFHFFHTQNMLVQLSVLGILMLSTSQ